MSGDDVALSPLLWGRIGALLPVRQRAVVETLTNDAREAVQRISGDHPTTTRQGSIWWAGKFPLGEAAKEMGCECARLILRAILEDQPTKRFDETLTTEVGRIRVRRCNSGCTPCYQCVVELYLAEPQEAVHCLRYNTLEYFFDELNRLLREENIGNATWGRRDTRRLQDLCDVGVPFRIIATSGGSLIVSGYIEFE